MRKEEEGVKGGLELLLKFIWFGITPQSADTREGDKSLNNMFDWKTDSLAVFGRVEEWRRLGKGRPSSAAACSTRKPPPELSAPEASMIQQGSRGTRTSTCSIPWAAKGGGK